MRKIKFAYNEPRLGDMEITTEEQGEYYSEEDILKLIEDQYPEAIDIEILSEEEFN